MAAEIPIFRTNHDDANEHNARIRSCLAVLDRYTFLTVSPDKFKEYEEDLKPHEREAFGAKAALSDFLGVMSESVQWKEIDSETRNWLSGQLAEFGRVLEEESRPTPDDLKHVTLILRDFLERVYPDKTIQELRQEIKTPQDPKASTEQTEFSVESAKLNSVRILHDARYEHDYYPEIPSLLGLTGDKKKDEEIIDRRERELAEKFFKGTWEKTLSVLRDIMQRNPQDTDARLYYMLSTNKIRTQWFESLVGPIDNLVKLGEPVEDLYQEAKKLVDEVRRKRNVLSKGEIARISREGKRTQSFSLKAPVTENDIRRAEDIIDRVFAVLYPGARDEKTGETNVRQLMEILGINKE